MFLFKGFTPLIRAALNGHIDIVEFLVSHGADVNDKSITGKFLILSCRDNLFLTFDKNIYTI